MADSKFLDLCLELQPLAQQFLDATNALFKCRITITWRSAEEQNTAKACHLSNAAAGQSLHNCVDEHGEPASRAFDFAIFEKDGTYVKNGTDIRYRQAGDIARGLGLKWGGDFKHGIDSNGSPYDHRDWDHIELA